MLEEDLEDFLDVFVQIKAFPTYIFFRSGKEVARVEGVNFDALNKMIDENLKQEGTTEYGCSSTWYCATQGPALVVTAKANFAENRASQRVYPTACAGLSAL